MLPYAVSSLLKTHGLTDRANRSVSELSDDQSAQALSRGILDEVRSWLLLR